MKSSAGSLSQPANVYSVSWVNFAFPLPELNFLLHEAIDELQVYSRVSLTLSLIADLALVIPASLFTAISFGFHGCLW